MNTLIELFDVVFIHRLRKIELPFARLAIFIVYFWFGILKLLGVSPAEQLVADLFQRTIHFMPFDTFYLFFSIFEMVIGVAFLIKGLERFAILLIGLHLITTILPLFFLPQISWQGFLVPTLVGQYIIKNVLIAGMAIVIGAKLVPLAHRHHPVKESV